jgi:riboflavin kinase/FMN adenylyltransferase
MRIIRGVDKRRRRTLCLALGVFDGVHVGHRRVIEAAVRQAKGRPLASAVLTFDPHPDAILAPAGAPRVLTTTEEKLAVLRELGIEVAVVARFSRQLANMRAERFVEEVLSGNLRARCVVVGKGWRFGRDGAGTPKLLRALGAGLGFRVSVVPPVSVKRAKISSTRIRELLLRGQVNAANELLGRPYALTGRVVAGEGRGRTLGFPTANLALPAEKLIPADGVYACLAGVAKRRPGMAYIGARPTFGERTERRVEIHLLEPVASRELRGRLLRVDLVARLRGDRRFGSSDALVAQMKRDSVRARALLTCLQG